MATANHHVEATAEQAYGQALGEVPRAQDGHCGPDRQTRCTRLSYSNSVLNPIGKETGLGVVQVVGGGGCEEHRAPAATHHGDGVHPVALSLLLWFWFRMNLMCLGRKTKGFENS